MASPNLEPILAQIRTLIEFGESESMEVELGSMSAEMMSLIAAAKGYEAAAKLALRALYREHDLRTQFERQLQEAPVATTDNSNLS